MQKDSAHSIQNPFTSFCHFAMPGPFVRKSLLVVFIFIFLSCFQTKSEAYDLVYDPVNWTENLLQYVQHLDQTSIQSTISATESTISQITSVISQYTQYISQVENLLQQATGTVTSKIAFLEGLYSQIMSIPTSFENAFQSILNIPNSFMNGLNGNLSGWGSYSNSTDPITRYLNSAVASLQGLTSAINNAGNWNGITYSPSRYAANLSQALAAQVLKNSNDANKTLATLQTNAKKATTLQTGQGVSNAITIHDLAARNQETSLQAAGNINEIQNQNALDQYKNTVIAGKEEQGMANLYGDFNP
jgi:phage-related protein